MVLLASRRINIPRDAGENVSKLARIYDKLLGLV